MTNKWPLHPKPYEHQLLYNWIKRLAEVYEISYQSFCRRVLGLTSEEISTLYAILPEKALITLSNGTGIPIDDLRKRDLDSIVERIQQALAELIKANPDEFDLFINKSVSKS